MFTFNCKGRLWVVDKPQVMGIINITPDSFYEGSRFTTEEKILQQAEKMINEGADILDIGGQSSRPGSKPVTAEEELERVIKPIQLIHKNFPETIISIDTYYATVAKQAVEAGASIVNDISAGTFDQAMMSTVAALKTPYIIMHMKGNPATMQENPVYDNVTKEVLDYLVEKKEECNKHGIYDVIIDPGFGFGKTIKHNFELLKNLSAFKIAGVPLLAGLSRKSTIYKTLQIPIEESLNGTTVMNTIALMNGAMILRVHDVREARQAVVLIGLAT